MEKAVANGYKNNVKAPDKLTITREFSDGRQNIPAADYDAFRNFFEKIVSSEQNFIAYK